MPKPLSEQALARLRDMLPAGSYFGREIEPELTRGGYVIVNIRSVHGSRWDITDKGRKAVEDARLG